MTRNGANRWPAFGSTGRRLAAASGCACGVALTGCVTDPPAPLELDTPAAYVEPDVYDRTARPITELIPTRAGRTDPRERTRRVADSTLTAQRPPAERASDTFGGVEAGEVRRVRLAFAGAPGAVVARTLLDEYMGVDYLVEEGLSGTVTMQVDEEMSVGDVSRLLHTLATIYGWVIERRDGITVVSAQDAETNRSPAVDIMRTRAAFGDATPALRVRRLRYLDPARVAGTGGQNALLSSILSRTALIATSGPVIVMGDTTARLNRASELLSVLDTPAFDGVRLVTYRLAHQDPADAAELLTSLASGTRLAGGEGGDALVQFIAVPDSDRLFVVARDATVLGQAELLIDQIDRADAAERRYRFLYRVQHADPTRLRAMVEGAFASRIEQDRNADTTDKMQMTWETQDGLLLVNATYDDYVDLMATMRALDVAPQQVLLQVVIAEVALTDDLQFGVEYFLDAIDQEGFGTIELTGTPGQVANPTGAAFFIGGSGLALVQALDAESSANVLSQPRLTALDGAEANFQVGGEVPVVSTSQNSDTQVGGDSTLIQEIERIETGIILTLQPRINESGSVRLTTNLEVRSVGADTPLGPTFDERTLQTEVLVPHGKTLVLAGFIDDQRDDSTSKTPLLGDIPGLGLAFNNFEQSTLRRELLLTITPRIINNPNESGLVVDEFLEAATRVRSVLSREPRDLPRGMLHDSSQLDIEPAVTLVLPPRPADDTRADQGQPIDPPARQREPEPQPAPDTEEERPEGPEIPGWMRQMLEQAAPNGGLSDAATWQPPASVEQAWIASPGPRSHEVAWAIAASDPFALGVAPASVWDQPSQTGPSLSIAMPTTTHRTTHTSAARSTPPEGSPW